jgi:hypothetical protein
MLMREEIDPAERLHKSAAGSTGQSPELHHFTKTEWPVIQALKSAHPKLLTQEAIEGATNSKVSVRTIARILPRFRDLGLVLQPKGTRSGWGLSEAGLRAAGHSG